MSTTATTTDARAARRAAEREQMKAAIDSLQTSDGWQRWLRVRRHFRTYSFHNQLLIAHQCPDATRVAGFRAWLKLGYCVRKGEQAIRIWAPVPPSKKALKVWRLAGSPPEDKPKTYFRLVAVFDRSQVQELPEHPGGPTPLDPPHEPLEGDGLARLRKPLTELAAVLGCEVAFEPIPGAAAGYHEPATGRIVIDDEGRSSNAQIATLIHEIAHALIRLDRRDDDPKLAYGEEEVVVESVAYCVCAAAGLDSGGDSVPYVAGWGGQGANDKIEAYAQLIDRLAHRIEAAIEPEEAS
ncbi:MAG TPA: ArdC family protein [Solirubrobacterales bacterium]|nr:ArdC family protein [Solirubrobacterales bacterium]